MKKLKDLRIHCGSCDAGLKLSEKEIEAIKDIFREIVGETPEPSVDKAGKELAKRLKDLSPNSREYKDTISKASMEAGANTGEHYVRKLIQQEINKI